MRGGQSNRMPWLMGFKESRWLVWAWLPWRPILVEVVAGWVTALIVIGWLVLAVAYVWLIYRIIKGWLALSDGRMDACLVDGAGEGFAAEGSPLHGIPNLHLTPRLGAHTREAKLRASWYVAHRIHDTLSPAAAVAAQRESDFSPLDSLHAPYDQDSAHSTPSQWNPVN